MLNSCHFVTTSVPAMSAEISTGIVLQREVLNFSLLTKSFLKTCLLRSFVTRIYDLPFAFSSLCVLTRRGTCKLFICLISKVRW